MRVIDFLIKKRSEGCVPQSREGKLVGLPSNAELRRWCKNGSVVINEKKVAAGNVVTHIDSLVFFPGPNQVTVFSRRNGDE